MLAGLLAAVVLLVGVVAVGGPLAAFRIAGQRDEAREQLWKSSLQEASAGRRSGLVGQRFDSLQALTRALAIRPSLELRNEAIACLALPDLHLAKQWPGNPHIHEPGFDPQLQRYARIDADRITVRQVADDRELFSLPSPGVSDYSVFSGDGRFLAVPYTRTKRGPYLHLWDLNSSQIVLEVPGNEHRNFAFSPDSRRVAVPQAGAGVALYELESGKEVRRLGKGADLGWVAFHPREPLLASNGAERNVEIWAVDTGSWSRSCLTRATWVRLPGETTAVCWRWVCLADPSRSGKRLAGAGWRCSAATPAG
jgi:hypothetical protein